MKIKAVRMHGAMDLRMDEVTLPELKSNQVLMQIRACGICGSDIACYEGRSVEGRYDIAPYIPGHEFGATIIKIGQEVKNFSVGDKVTGDCTMGCNACVNCKNGLMPSACLNTIDAGFRPDSPGAMGEYMIMNEANIHKIPDDWSFEEAALVEAFAIGYFGVWGRGGSVDATDDVLIFGAGTIGVCAAITAKASSCKVIIADPVASRRQKALQFGADIALDPLSDDFFEQVLYHTGGHGPTITIEAAGNSAAAAAAIKAAGQCSKIRFIGINMKQLPVIPFDIVSKNLTIAGYSGTEHFMTRTIKFMSRIKDRYDLQSMCTKYFDFKDTVQAFDYAANNKEDNLKVMIRFP
ncbi:alcohol dehydrogenase catalytic domain-containing protein [Butyricicoccus faecihominis]|uniref:zinc-dependent alcohol dehydrogenase n=1 Tax=Butyricicoccus faecihominis TaxID=1712515 RepID=UPI002479B373|nr:alcohol dehydrogenase catalytic domain-containing protein [Butyricicoccus faecihominis]MCQ5130474.1 alcohol dehydrogenase catalytic domain-containing protein [Butyricicoccus faecihominis]